jgi:hypothetical protein
MRGDPVACFSDQTLLLRERVASKDSHRRESRNPTASYFSLYLRADRTDAQSSSTAIYTRVVQ